MSSVPREVSGLVKRFERNLADYKATTYNETQVRREFIDPLFKALGWDVDNEQGYAEAYKDVIHEDAIKIGGATKAPDYCFRIGGVRKFFLEAKKPAIPLKDQPEPAFQLRRYAWSARLPLSILTDFEELAVYDCRIRPHKNDKPSAARTMYFTYDQYPDRWDELASVFSREEVLKGSFDRYAESTRRKRGTAEVDVEFLREIERWRETLATNFALRNGDLSVRDLNFAVQRTIDRVIFLRMCEDRGIEQYGQLLGLCGGPTIYPRLGQVFRRADERYNSSLFYFTPEAGREPPDELTLGLDLDDKPLKEILRSLYYPESPYEFSVLAPEILGQVYEQFLGKVIRLTKAHRAKVEEKPEVRKAGGVYYTPTYIVDYIVKHTVGKLLEGKTPASVGPDPKPSPKRKRGGGTVKRKLGRGRDAPLRVLDPACGSGSFLLGAYQYLLDWHRDWYVDDGPDNHRDRIYQGAGGQWRLTIGEKKRILLNNIYGVDIDPAAVEVTKLSLLLKVLEGESSETVGQTLRLFHERALPDLADNIKCGNSLIGPDFYDNRQMDLLDEEERYRINAFDWQAEFPEVFPNPSRQGGARPPTGVGGSDPSALRADGTHPNNGFDAVIGNPPYVSMLNLDKTLPPTVKPYWKRRYASAAGAFDIYVLFVEQGVGLLRNDGLLSYIIPNKVLAAEYARSFRQWIADNTRFISLLDLSRVKVWQAAVYPIVPVFSKARPDPTSLITVAVATSPTLDVSERLRPVRADLLSQVPDNIWSFITRPGNEILMKVLALSVPLESLNDVCGATTVAEGSEYPALIAEADDLLDQAGFARFVVSGSVYRYATSWDAEPVQFVHQKYLRPLIRLTEPMPARRIEQAHTQKIIICKVALEPRAFVDLEGQYVGAYTTYVLPGDSSLEFVAGVLNSRLIAFIYRALYDALAMGSGYLRYQPPQLRRIPVCRLNLSNRDDKRRHDRMVALVQQMLDLHKELSAAKTTHDKAVLQRQIDATDRQIDRLVYELYGLTEEETRIVEEATR